MRARKSHRLAGIALIALVSAVVLWGAVLQPAASATEQTRKVIATSTSNGFRVAVSAIRQDTAEPSAASVEIAALERQNGAWVQLGPALRIGSRGGWFWHVVASPHSVRDFSLDTDTPERVAIRLLVTPSIGWSSLYRFHIENGVLVRG